MPDRWKALAGFSSVFLRVALGGSFLSAVADRFGFWGAYGRPNVAWGDYARFVDYTASLNWFLPAAVIPALAMIATAAEALFGILLVLGWKTRISALLSGALLTTFAMTMTVALGVKAPLNFSVFSAAGASLLLATCAEFPFSLDGIFQRIVKRQNPAGAELRLKELDIRLPAPPQPFGTYVEAVQAGNLLFLSGMLPTEKGGAEFVGRVGAELDVETGRKAARLATLNALSVARQHLRSLDRVVRIVRLGVSVATSGDVRNQPGIADASSELLQEIFGRDRNPCRLVYGVASLPLGVPVELEVIFEIAE